MEGWQVFFEIPGKPPVELREGESIIGRSRTSAVHIPETTVSRQHAKVTVAGGAVTLTDLGSANGTLVNDEKVEGTRPLADGDRLLVGDAELVIRILAPADLSDATVRVVIPPLGPPPAGATVRMDFADPAGPAAAAAAAPPPAPQPVAPPPPPVAPPPQVAAPAPPPVAAAPARPAPPPPPVIAPPPPAPPLAPAAGDVLGSIEAIDQLPLTPPAAAAAARPGAGAVPLRPAGAPGAAGGSVQYAGFWIRVVAALIDAVPMFVLAILGTVLSIFVDPMAGMLVNLLTLPYWFYVALFMPATRGTTIGKRMMGLAIITDGVRPGQGLGWGKAFMRLLGHMVAGMTASIGYLLVAFTTHKQGLHDMIAGTFVVRTR